MMPPPVRGVLERWGSGVDSDRAGALVPAVLRGTGAVLAVPPSPSHAALALAAAFSRSGPGGLALVLTADTLLEAWPPVVGPLAQALGRPALVAPGATGAARGIRNLAVALITPAEAAAELLRRSALPVNQVRAVVIAWPELAPTSEVLATILQDLPHDCPRVVVTADPAGQAEVIERYAWRAPVTGPLGSGAPEPPAATRLRVAETTWTDRPAALAALVDLLDPSALAVWTADRSQHEVIRARLAAAALTPAFATGPELGEGLAVAFDPPPPEVLARMDGRDAVLLMPPGTAGYAGRWVSRLEPVVLPGPLGTSRSAMAAERERIRARIGSGEHRAAFATLGPLFDRYPAQEVAAALHELWTEARQSPPAPPRALAEPARRPRVWASAGRKDGASVGEWLAFLTQDLEVPRDEVTRVELRDTFTLLECRGAAEAEALVERLAGRTFRSRRLAARIDRGPERPRPGARRPPGRRSA